MAGAGKKRAKQDKKANGGNEKSSEGSHLTPDQQQSVRAYDGPGESSRGAPASSGQASQGRGRQGSTAPPSAGQPSVGQQSVRSPSGGPPSASVRSASRGRAPSQVRGSSTNILPDRTALMSAARYVDLPGNAYTFGNELCSSRVALISFAMAPASNADSAPSNPDKSDAGPSNATPKPGSNPVTQSSSTSFVIPGSADAHKFVTAHPDLAEKFKAFLDAFYLANNIWHKAYTGIKCIDRVGFSTAGKEAIVAINSHKVLKFPTNPVFQYDVTIGNGVEKRGVINAVWNSKLVQSKFPPGVLFDGNKLAWHMRDVGEELRFHVDLDADRGQQSRNGDNTFRVGIKRTATLHLGQLQAYLDGKVPMDETVISAITFLDHLLRETPGRNAINIRRSYFDRQGPDRANLGQGVEAMKGVYQSMRAAQGKHMVVNVDVSNAVFWNEQSLMNAAREVTGLGSYAELANKSQPQKASINARPQESPAMVHMRKLKKNEIFVKHKGRTQKELEKSWKIKAIIQETPRTKTFPLKDRATKEILREVTVEQYYKEKYNVTLMEPNLPLVETTKKGVFYPMELCYLAKGQRYPYKLNETQTASMIKFAVTRPEGRKQSIAAGLKLLNWGADRYLHNYGVQIDGNMLKTKARVLDPPALLYGKNAKIEPKFTGRWDLRGKQFLIGNSAPLKSWGVCVFPGRGSPSKEVIQNFISSFINIYKGHGGRVENTNPAVIQGTDDIGASVQTLFNAAGNQAQARPQMLVFILLSKNTEVYGRIKKSADCRYGVMSQCMQAAHVLKNQPQYHSNVCMKFNAKLGGTTNKVALRGKPPMSGHFSKPTMIIGADVSHAAPGSLAPSFAAMTMSLDTYCSRYAAAVQSNGHRVEMIATQTIAGMMTPMFNHWSQNIGQGNLPSHVIYFRDGVSAAQYTNVIKYEVAALKGLLHNLSKHNANYKVNFTVIIAEKRHHIRIFPERGIAADKNGNPVPGTLVDRDVTEPFGYDFYLNSHSAIQGTARPTHYTVIMDEEKMAPDQLQTMIYEHVYQYMRATTPVSLHPAVYYAHLASKRAVPHQDKGFDEQKAEESGHSSGDKPETEVKPLLDFHDGPDKGQFGMWYI